MENKLFNNKYTKEQGFLKNTKVISPTPSGF